MSIRSLAIVDILRLWQRLVVICRIVTLGLHDTQGGLCL